MKNRERKMRCSCQVDIYSINKMKNFILRKPWTWARRGKGARMALQEWNANSHQLSPKVLINSAQRQTDTRGHWQKLKDNKMHMYNIQVREAASKKHWPIWICHTMRRKYPVPASAFCTQALEWCTYTDLEQIFLLWVFSKHYRMIISYKWSSCMILYDIQTILSVT